MHPKKRAERLSKEREKFVKKLKIGEFKGHFQLEWIGPDNFNYHPDPNDPFRYIRNLGKGKTEVIQPESIETDGGSIPVIAQLITGRTPWEYAPAYLIHDWEFHCHDDDPNFKKSFKEVNLTLAEAIWTLMNEGYLNYVKPVLNAQNVHLIYTGVSSPVGKRIWKA
jgi:hypothetical protein